MRSGLVAALMGIGGILLAFGVTVLMIAIFTRTGEWRPQLPQMLSVATLVLVVGGAMFVAGFLLDRVGRRSAERTPA